MGVLVEGQTTMFRILVKRYLDHITFEASYICEVSNHLKI